MTALLKESAIDLTVSPEGEQKVYIAGEDVTEAIRTDGVSNQVSIVAKYAGIREEMTKRQQQLAEKGGVVMDGRDIGTHVLPECGSENISSWRPSKSGQNAALKKTSKKGTM